MAQHKGWSKDAQAYSGSLTKERISFINEKQEPVTQ